MIRELELIDELLKKIKTNLTNGDYQKAILIAEHGASRLAVIHETENLWEMADGTRVQERDISNISSTRRNPVLADIFGRLGYMERQGSGFKKITESCHAAHNYRKELEPEFYSDVTSFQVMLYNLNYGTTTNSANVTIEDEKIDFIKFSSFCVDFQRL